MWTRSDVDSIKADKPADIANLFNNYFYTVYKPPCSASVYEELLPSNQLNLHLQHISQLHLSPGEVLDVLHHLDVSKATGPDKIPAKLHLFGIRGSLFCCFSDYLGNRFQQVTVLGKTSNLLPDISGDLQGSILGPLMFLIYVNDLATVSVNSSIALFADDTKCYRPVMNIDDGRLLQEDLDRITLWCQDWRMNLNQSKCTVMSITRNVSPVISSYMLQNAPVQRTDAQKDRGILVCKNLKWNCHVLEAASKANRMLGFIRRSTLEVKIQSTRKALFKALVVMSNLSYSSQVWAPQSVKLIEIIERVQRRATKYILSLPYRTDISYKERLRLTELIPLCYWHEYLDLVYTYKSIVNNTDTQFKISKPMRVTRRTASSKSVLLDIPKAKTVTFQNSFYSRASRTFNTLPEYLRDNTQSINLFKTKLRKHYVDLTLTVYDPAVPQTFKSVCIKCHMTRPLTALLVKLCC